MNEKRKDCNFQDLVFKKAMMRMKDEGHLVDVIYLEFAHAF